MGAKDYDFSDLVPEYRESNRISYKKSDDKTRKRRSTPKSKSLPGGIRQRRNKRIVW